MNAKTLRKYGKNEEMLMGSIPVICFIDFIKGKNGIKYSILAFCLYNF